MTETVVHVFEIVEVEQKKRVTRFASNRTAQCVFEAVPQERTVCKSSEGVVKRSVGEFAFDALSGRDVEKN